MKAFLFTCQVLSVMRVPANGMSFELLLSVGDGEEESVAKEQIVVEDLICIDLSSSLNDSVWLLRKNC